jgi:hypothetical protein
MLPKVRTKASLLFRRGESLVEGLGLDSAHGHALAVDRVEAANRITQYDKPRGEVPEPLVAMSYASREMIMHHIGQWLAMPDRLIQLRGRQRSGISEELLMAVRNGFVKVCI